MTKLLLFILVNCAIFSSAQLLSIQNLHHLSLSSEQILETKLTAHFDLLHQPADSEENVKVYSNHHLNDKEFMVVTVFLKDQGCHVFSVVSHDLEQVKSFEEDLIKNQFKSNLIKNAEAEDVHIFEKNDVKVLIKKPSASLTAHQIVWMCK